MNTKHYKARADEIIKSRTDKRTFYIISAISAFAEILLIFSSQLANDETTIDTVYILPLISMAINLFTNLFVSPVFDYSIYNISFKITNNKEFSLRDIFSAFDNFFTVFFFNLLQITITMVGMICFIVPGVIASYSFALGYFIIAENPEMSSSEVLMKSKEMMNGHRWELFKLDFSFAGWYILSLLTLGILAIWTIPRHTTARAVFYQNLKNQLYGEDINSYPYENEPVDNNPLPIINDNSSNTVYEAEATEEIQDN